MSDRKHGCRWKVDGQPTELDRRVLEMARRGCLVPGRELVKTPEQIEGIRRSGAVNTGVLDCVAAMIGPGVSTAEIDRAVYDYTTSHGAIPAPLNYEDFPKSVCTSVNDVVCHGIPSEREILRDGDIVNVDVSTILDGYYSDASRMFLIGNVSPERRRLVEVTRECLRIGMEAARPFGFVGDIGHAIQRHAEKNGYSVVRELCGHGIHDRTDDQHGLAQHLHRRGRRLDGPDRRRAAFGPVGAYVRDDRKRAGNSDLLRLRPADSSRSVASPTRSGFRAPVPPARDRKHFSLCP